MKTYGCQMNVYDSGRMADLLKPLGYELTDVPNNADMMILNTCHIREKATEKVFSDLGRLKPHKQERAKDGKQTIIAVAGCVAQAEGDLIMRRAKYVDMVFGPQTYHRLPEMIAMSARKQDETGRGILDVDFPTESKFDSLPTPTSSNGPSAFLTIQEGCDKFCHFCCVPYTRGAEFSRSVEEIITEAKHLVDQGIIEITLLGQNVNAYHGLDQSGKEIALGQLLHELAKIDEIKRIRYTTSHPKDVDDALIEAHRDIPKLMPFLHLPVQSGSDKILAAMNRKHDATFYLDVVEKLRKARPELEFSSDFIVGYPGETDQDFQDTMNLVAQVRYAQCFSFKYSPRPGTPAAVHELQVPEQVKEDRLGQLQNLLFKQQTEFNFSQIGKEVPVLFDKPGRQEGQLIGRSPFMQAVYAQAPSSKMGQICNVTITGATQNSINGHIDPA